MIDPCLEEGGMYDEAKPKQCYRGFGCRLVLDCPYCYRAVKRKPPEGRPGASSKGTAKGLMVPRREE